MADLHISFEIIKPKNHKLIGSEAPDLCFIVARLGKIARQKVVDPILDGFEHNFNVEGSAEGPWQQLARSTRDEREELKNDPGLKSGLVPGFTSAHPILQRFGDYKRSWIDRTHEKHLEEWGTPRSIPLGGGATFILPLVEVDVGSTDFRVPELSGESGRKETNIFGEEEFAFEGYTPARPVHPIEAEFEARLGARLDLIHTHEARMIPKQKWT